MFWKSTLVVAFVCAVSLTWVSVAATGRAADGGVAQEKTCMECHREETPGIVKQWENSAHAGTLAVCGACHMADSDTPGAFEHYGDPVQTIVSPRRCGICHSKEAREFAASHHADAAQYAGSDDNYLGMHVEGTAAAASGCQQCHGSEIELSEDGRPTAPSWPNTGIGRINPDGSKGSCTACHARHEFSVAQARRPEACGRCHMGPDHPQLEIFRESKHGVLYAANRDEMALESEEWAVGKDYSAAPTCASCHMGATPDQAPTHDVGTRISWTLRPVVSEKTPDWRSKRLAMQGVCGQCHGSEFVDGFYRQYDAAVNLYNDRYGRPARKIMDELYAEDVLTDEPFDEEIEWVYFELWHHEGRRARHGAAMMGPDYVQWHGFYEVAKHFRNEFLPLAEELSPGIAEKLDINVSGK